MDKKTACALMALLWEWYLDRDLNKSSMLRQCIFEEGYEPMLTEHGPIVTKIGTWVEMRPNKKEY